MDRQEWLESLHTGAKVIMYDWFEDWQGISKYSKKQHSVERVTKTKIILWGGHEFSRKNGRRLNCHEDVDCFIVPIDYQESEDEQERQTLAAMVSEFTWSKLTLEQLQQIKKIIKEKV